jgi:para-aminobenzoate synthetase component 1
VAEHVDVTRFRYVDELKTNKKNLLQVSSEISGILPSGYERRLGNIIMSLLPAGSVSGAPKPKTIAIIKEAEQQKRGYYTGVFGYFDGKIVDSGVMIRYIEYEDGKLFYRSGGGITTQSVEEHEYQEMIDKIYVPLN